MARENIMKVITDALKVFKESFFQAKTIADKKLAKELVVLYHEGHRGRRDLELATERMLLTI